MPQEKLVRTHSNPSQRVKRNESDRKVVFKGVLDNPHRVLWPTVPLNTQNAILAHLVGLLEGVAEHHIKRCIDSRKRKRAIQDEDDASRPNSKPRLEESALKPSSGEGSKPMQSDELKPPHILAHLSYGINEVTKYLEAQIQSCRSKVSLRNDNKVTNNAPQRPYLRYLFVCRSDVDPPILIDHLPHLVATYNTLRQGESPQIILTPLPKGAEATLAQAIGVRRVAVLAIDDTCSAKERLKDMDSLQIVTAPWLSSESARSFVQTHIKQVKTTAPRDMKATKTMRVEGKRLARERKIDNKS